MVDKLANIVRSNFSIKDDMTLTEMIYTYFIEWCRNL